jgi:hypothetical protein
VRGVQKRQHLQKVGVDGCVHHGSSKINRFFPKPCPFITCFGHSVGSNSLVCNALSTQWVSYPNCMNRGHTQMCPFVEMEQATRNRLVCKSKLLSHMCSIQIAKLVLSCIVPAASSYRLASIKLLKPRNSCGSGFCTAQHSAADA